MNATPNFDPLSPAATNWNVPFELDLSYRRATAGSNRPSPAMNATGCSPAYAVSLAFEGQTYYPSAQLSEAGFSGHGDFPSAGLEREDGQETEPFICEDCHRPFLRSCDLNKHAKTHSRPFKCPVPGCKFYHLGWPTEKELERHHNDVHSSRPQIFTCHYPPCPYTSKRESNLKQHMEKTHGWKYVRSRSSRSYRCPAPGCSDCSCPDDTRQRHGITVAAPIRTRSSNALPDFVLYPDPDPEPTPLSAPGAAYADGPEEPWPESYVPWASPPSRGQNLSKFLQNVESIIKVPSELPLDPQLTRPRYVPTTEAPLVYQVPHQPEHLSVQQPLVNVPLKMSCSPPVFALGTPAAEWTSAGHYTTSKNAGSGGNTPAAGTSHPAAAAGGSNTPVAPITPQSARRGRPLPSDDGGDSGEDEDSDEEPPHKRTKYLPDDEFDEKKMPCPFFLADSAFFNRETQERFSPCHTKHKEVSTIVRHLGRPAHQLHTDSRSVHSFDRPEMAGERPRPKAGICKLCWRIFRDRQEFDLHVAQVCNKVSRGKREKFMQLFSAFCTDGDDGQPEPSRPRALSHAASLAPGYPDADRDESGEGAEPSEAEDDSENGDVKADEVVTAREHRALVERMQAVESRHESLRTDHLALQNRYRFLEDRCRQMWRALATRAARPNPPPPPTHAFVARLPPDDAQAHALASVGSLVGGMKSHHQLAVHRAELMDDLLLRDAPAASRRPASGFSSGSDRSSVRHVPHSPRFLSPKGEGAGVGGAGGGGGADADGRLKTPRQAVRTSTDSGYASSSTKGKASVVQGGAETAAEGAESPPRRPVEAAPSVGAATEAPPARSPPPFDEADPEDILQPAGVADFDTMWPEGN